jgi:hypothetical protein
MSNRYEILEESMAESVNEKVDDSEFRSKANKAINKMLNCLLTDHKRPCKGCNDVNACTFLTEAVFVYRNQLMGKQRQAL